MNEIIIKDYSGLSGKPKEISVPSSKENLKDILRKYKNSKIRIGAGLSGLTGAAVPDEDELYISMLGFDTLKWADVHSGIVFAGAGVRIEILKSFAEEAGWSFPVIPFSEKMATVGGMIATNAGGPMSVRYGKIENYVKGIEFTDVNGNEYDWGSASKNVSEGPAFYKSLVGSEGTLGFVTGAFLACVPKLPKTGLLRIAHEDFFNLLPLIPTLLKMDPILMEMAEQSALRFSSGAEESVIWVGLEEEIDLAQRIPFRISYHDYEEYNEFSKIKTELQHYKRAVNLDVSFPVRQTMPVLSSLKSILENHQIENTFYGHAGLGNWHIGLFTESKNESFEAQIEEIDRILWHHQGNISGEYCIGRLNHLRLNRFVSEDWKNIYKLMKSYFDPESRLPSLLKTD